MSVTWFDSSTLAVCLTCLLIHKGNRDNSLFIALSMSIYIMIASLDLSSMEQYYYVLIASIELWLVSFGIAFNIKPSILIIFLMSIVYNTLSFIEYSTNFVTVHNNYEIVMQGLIISLLVINFKNGVIDGASSDHNNSGVDDSISHSRFFRRSTS